MQTIQNSSLDDNIVMRAIGLQDQEKTPLFFWDIIKSPWEDLCLLIMQTSVADYGRVFARPIKYLLDPINENIGFDTRIFPKSLKLGDIFNYKTFLPTKEQQIIEMYLDQIMPLNKY